VRHDRHYTLEQARELLPWVRERLAGLREAAARLTDAETRRALVEGSAGNGGGTLGRRLGEAFVAVQSGVAEFAARDIVLRDLHRGLVDFPALREGREVYLCLIDGEDDIAFWHDLDAGYAGRQPL
jgi:hypothetical protein